MSIRTERGRSRARWRPCAARVPLAILSLAPVGIATAQDAAVTLTPIVVTAPMQASPLTVETDPKAPRQPVPASDGADFLKSIPGFSTIRKGGSNGDPVLRGMAGSRLNVLIDGGQIGGGCPSRMDPPTAYISPQLYDKVTVIKGPETVLYGPGNSAGTVLFEREFRRYAEPSASFEGSLLGGSWGRSDQMVDLRAGAPAGYIGVSANHTRSKDYEDGDGRRVHSAYERWNVDGTLGWTPNDDTRLELTAGKGNGHAAYAFSGMDGAQFLRKSVGLKYEQHHLSDAFDTLVAQAYYNYADHVMDNYTLRQPNPDSMMPMAMASDVDRRTTGGRLAGTFKWDTAELTAGVDASANTHSVRNGGPPGSPMGYYRDLPRQRDARIGIVGAFAEWRWTFVERQRVITGARVDRAHARGYALATMPPNRMGGGRDGDMGGMPVATEAVDASRSSTLPSGFVRYERDWANAPATFYAGLGHVERFPDYWELVGQHTQQTLDAFLSVRPERTTQLDVGLQYRTSRLKAWVSGYAGVVNDFILFHYGRGMMAVDHATNVDARIAGGEAGVVYAFTPHWKADATLAYAWGQNRTEHRPLPQMPPLETRLGLTYNSGRWSAGALWRIALAQRRVATDEGNIVGQDLGSSAGFGVFSLNGGLRLGHGLTLSAGLDNMFDKVYAEHINAAVEGLAGYVNTVRVNEPGRTAWIKLDANL